MILKGQSLDIKLPPLPTLQKFGQTVYPAPTILCFTGVLPGRDWEGQVWDGLPRGGQGGRGVLRLQTCQDTQPGVGVYYN